MKFFEEIEFFQYKVILKNFKEEKTEIKNNWERGGYFRWEIPLFWIESGDNDRRG